MCPSEFETIADMSRLSIFGVAFLVCAATLSSKDKSGKVPFQDMALGMRDAFNCGVVVEQYLHGRLKGNADAYRKERDAYNCDHVEAVLSTLHDQDGGAPPQ